MSDFPSSDYVVTAIGRKQLAVASQVVPNAAVAKLSTCSPETEPCQLSASQKGANHGR